MRNPQTALVENVLSQCHVQVESPGNMIEQTKKEKPQKRRKANLCAMMCGCQCGSNDDDKEYSNEQEQVEYDTHPIDGGGIVADSKKDSLEAGVPTMGDPQLNAS